MITLEQGLKRFRAGHTVWRCMLGRHGEVTIREVTFQGKRVVINGSVKLQPKVDPGTSSIFKILSGNYISDTVGDGGVKSPIRTFDTRRKALRFVEEVKAGLHPEYVRAVRAHYQMCDDFSAGLDRYTDYQYDYMDDYVDPRYC
jgi:hypothetical protein